MTVHGRFYLPPAPVRESRRLSVDLERGDAAVQDVLDGHGVSLAACVQTFDVMEVRILTDWEGQHGGFARGQQRAV